MERGITGRYEVNVAHVQCETIHPFLDGNGRLGRAKSMAHLIELGIVRELTGNRRNRVFAYDQHLAVLAEGTEPL